tara:strand:+ start:3180 stop:3425 length:246 start_codon:yes stop_codon:yes gene_type:complete
MPRNFGKGNGCLTNKQAELRSQAAIKRNLKAKKAKKVVKSTTRTERVIVTRREVMMHSVEIIFDREFINNLQSDLDNGRII